MQSFRAFLRAGHTIRPGTIVAVVALVALVYAAWGGEQRRANMRSEIRWLRARLAEKRTQFARQREEMTQVAAATERVARTASALLERTTGARRLVQMEETRGPAMIGFIPVATIVAEGGHRLASEEGARALEQLSVIDGELSNAADSVAVLTALLQERPFGATRDVPSIWPVRGAVTSAFGSRPSPWDGSREMHPGIDIQAGYGTPVAASADGEVILAGRDAGYGGLVIVSHGADVDTFYGHLSALYVREGQRVKRGQTVGAVGASGRATGAHLHYEVRVRNRPVDPKRYLN